MKTKSTIIDSRSDLILGILIEEYIKSAEPVGSRTISKKLESSFSPATIRNIMADLEEVGFLTRPHISAGRVPTEKGFRYYVDSLLKTKVLPKKQRSMIEDHLKNKPDDLAGVLRSASNLLSIVTHYPGLVTAPRFDNIVLEHIEFIHLPYERIMVVFVSQSGMAETKVISNEEYLTPGELQKISNYLNEIIGGMTILEVRARLMQEIEDDKNRFDRLLYQALKLGQRAIEFCAEDDIILEGTFNIFHHPDFDNRDSLKSIFRAFEEKKAIINLLNRIISSKGVQILIGSETNFAGFKGLSLIVANYRCEGRVLGALGVVGPTRMDYSKIIPVVDYTAKSLGSIFQ